MLLIVYLSGVIATADRYSAIWGDICSRCGAHAFEQALMWPIREIECAEDRCEACNSIIVSWLPVSDQ